MTLHHPPPAHKLNVSNISAITDPIWFGWNFKDSFLGTSRIDYYCLVDICPGNICPGDICTYQEYLSCYWRDVDRTLNVGLFLTEANHNDDICPGNVCPGNIYTNQQFLSCFWSHFDQTFKTQYFGVLNFCQEIFCWNKNLLAQIFFGPTIFFGRNLFSYTNSLEPWGFLSTNIFFDQTSSDPNLFWPFFDLNLSATDFFLLKFFYPKIVWI